MATLSVHDYKEVAKGTLRSLIRSAGLTVDEFIALTRKKFLFTQLRKVALYQNSVRTGHLGNGLSQ